MLLYPAAQTTNVKVSMIKFFNDNFTIPYGTFVSHDPNIGQPFFDDQSIDEWIAVLIRNEKISGSLMTYLVSVYACTRNDPQGLRLSGITDKIVGFFSSVYTGTGTTKVTGTSMTGTGSAYDTELVSGMDVEVAGQSRVIDVITGATTATVTVAFSPNLTGEYLRYQLYPPDGNKRIPLYNEDYSEVGKLVVTGIFPSIESESPDQTKFRLLTIVLKCPVRV